MTLQEKVVQKVSGLSEDNLQFLLEMIERFMQTDSIEKAAISNRIGIAKGQKLYVGCHTAKPCQSVKGGDSRIFSFY